MNKLNVWEQMMKSKTSKDKGQLYFDISLTSNKHVTSAHEHTRHSIARRVKFQIVAGTVTELKDNYGLWH